MNLERIDHVQLAMPASREGEARRFYSDLLGLPEVRKPKALAASGGAWFENENVHVHLGVDPDFKPAKKAHPAFQVCELRDLTARLRAAGIEFKKDDRLPGYARIFTNDPFGNRLEFMEAMGEA